MEKSAKLFSVAAAEKLSFSWQETDSDKAKAEKDDQKEKEIVAGTEGTHLYQNCKITTCGTVLCLITVKKWSQEK